METEILKKRTLKLENPQVFYATVFNATQIEGLKPLKEDLDLKEVLTEFTPIEAAEKILENSQAKIIHRAGDNASYAPTLDRIQLPLKEQFNSQADYYATALHELGHWSGHESRLNRDLSHPFGSMGYAKEELRAEIGSYMLSSKLGIDFNPDQHHAYINSWVSILDDKPSEIFRAAADASKMATFITGLQHEPHQKEAITETIETEASPMPTPKESFSTLMTGAIEQMNDQELDLKTLQHALPVLSKGVELDEMRTAIIKTQEMLLHNLMDEPIKEQVQALVTLLESVYHTMEEAYTQAEEASRKENRERDTQALKAQSTPKYEEKTFLAVPYQEKEEAKWAGAKWDRTANSWYAPKGADKTKLQPWSIESQEMKQLANQPIDIQRSSLSFKEALEQQGLIIKGEPIMDGKIQRVSVVGDKRGQKSGAYVGYRDGVPAGFIQNHKLGTKINWKATDHTFSNGLTQESIAAQKALNEAKRLERMQAQEKEQERVARDSEKLFNKAQSTDSNHPYLLDKQVENYGLKLDASNNLLMPLQDIHGKHWSHQKINTHFKGFPKGSKKEGNFFIIGNHDLSKSQELILVEGYATGASVYAATQKTVIVAVDSGNLTPVAQALHQKYPKTTLLIAGDNDIQKELEGKPNVGKEKALEAAQSVHAQSILPSFSQSEIKQGATDFNDLAQLRGVKAVKRLIETALTKAKKIKADKHQERVHQNQEEQKKHKQQIVRKNSVGFSR